VGVSAASLLSPLRGSFGPSFSLAAAGTSAPSPARTNVSCLCISSQSDFTKSPKVTYPWPACFRHGIRRHAVAEALQVARAVRLVRAFLQEEWRRNRFHRKRNWPLACPNPLQHLTHLDTSTFLELLALQGVEYHYLVEAGFRNSGENLRRAASQRCSFTFSSRPAIRLSFGLDETQTPCISSAISPPPS